MVKIDFSVFLVFIVIHSITCNKSRVETENYESEFKTLQRPFRVAKLNLVWTKAQHRLTDPKLVSLYTELKLHDKEEIAYKQVKDKDKEGLKAAELRQKLIGILSTYDLLEHFEDTENPEKYKQYSAHGTSSDTHKNKSLFKDKKLNRLWEKVEMAGFTAEELQILKQEFQHHQEKLDMYYSLLQNIGKAKKTEYHENAVNEDELEQFNEIVTLEGKGDVKKSENHEYTSNLNKLRDHHRGIRNGYDRLERMTAKGPNNKDFIEPKVQTLWKIALANNFSDDELSSLKFELHHYESRLLKLRHLNAEHAVQSAKHKTAQYNDKQDRLTEMEDLIKKQSRKVEKFQEDIEKKIFKHVEL